MCVCAHACTSKYFSNNNNNNVYSQLRKLCTTQQDINLNSSCDENSPTKLKIKRRVSFAEKKHVK